MILNIDLAGKELVVTKAPEPKLFNKKPDEKPEQRRDKQSDEPLWTTQVVVTDDDGGTIIGINTAGEPPDVRVGDEVKVSGLVAIPWFTSGRNGIAYRAESIVVLD